MKPLIAILFCAVALAAYAAGAARKPVPPRLTGAELAVQLLGESDIPRSKQTPSVIYKQRYAEGYVDGVVDATEGRLWCAPPQYHGREIDDLAYTALRQRRPAALPPNAAHFLIEQYSAAFPCP